MYSRAMCCLSEYAGTVGVIGARVVGADCASVDQFLQGITHGAGLLWRVAVQMKLIKVDIVRVKSLQRSLASGTDIFGRSIRTGALTGRFIKGIAELCRNDDFIPSPFEGARKHTLTMARAVNVRCIKEVDAEIEPGMNGADRLFVVDLSPARRRFTKPERATNRPTAQPHGANLNTGTSQRTHH